MKTFIYDNDTLVGVSNGTLTLTEVSSAVANPIVKARHYSHKVTKNRFASFTVNGNLGVIQLGYGIRPRMKHTVSKLITGGNYCEFDRMWLDDCLPKTSETQVIGLLMTYVKTKFKHIHFIITYADGSVGNTGTIYRASNAISIGRSVVDFYILPPTTEFPEGERVHPVTMWHRHKTRKKAVLERLYPGYKRVKGTPKNGPFQNKYLYVLHKGTLKAYLREQDAGQVSGVRRGGPSPKVRFNPGDPLFGACKWPTLIAVCFSGNPRWPSVRAAYGNYGTDICFWNHQGAVRAA